MFVVQQHLRRGGRVGQLVRRLSEVQRQKVHRKCFQRKGRREAKWAVSGVIVVSGRGRRVGVMSFGLVVRVRRLGLGRRVTYMLSISIHLSRF